MTRALVSVLATALFISPGRAAQDATRNSLTRTIAETTALAERVVPQEQRQGVVARLARAKAAADAGRLHLALYEFEGAFVMTNAHAFASEAASIKTDEEFGAAWKATGEPKVQTPAAPHSPSLIAAMASSAARRAPTTYRAALPYGQDAGVPAGLYYLGETKALAAFADLARGLPWKREGSAPPIRSIKPELEKLNTVQRRYANDVSVLAIAVDSPRDEVTNMAESVKASYDVVFGTADIVKAFGEVAAVPKVLIFDRAGKLRRAIHGAPPNLDEQLEAAITSAFK